MLCDYLFGHACKVVVKIPKHKRRLCWWAIITEPVHVSRGSLELFANTDKLVH